MAQRRSRICPCYLFLDIDGVLNCAPSRIAAQRLEGEEQQTLALAGAPSLLANLKHIVDQTGAHIVLSSTWRLEEATRRAVNMRLRTVGLSLVGSTPDLAALESGPSHAMLCEDDNGEFSPELERAIEIRRWLDAADKSGTPFVAIDDMDLTCPGNDSNANGLAVTNFVQTDDMHGLTRGAARTVVTKLAALQESHYWPSRRAPHVGPRCQGWPPTVPRDVTAKVLRHAIPTIAVAADMLAAELGSAHYDERALQLTGYGSIACVCREWRGLVGSGRYLLLLDLSARQLCQRFTDVTAVFARACELRAEHDLARLRLSGTLRNVEALARDVDEASVMVEFCDGGLPDIYTCGIGRGVVMEAKYDPNGFHPRVGGQRLVVLDFQPHAQ